MYTYCSLDSLNLIHGARNPIDKKTLLAILGKLFDSMVEDRSEIFSLQESTSLDSLDQIRSQGASLSLHSQGVANGKVMKSIVSRELGTERAFACSRGAWMFLAQQLNEDVLRTFTQSFHLPMM